MTLSQVGRGQSWFTIIDNYEELVHHVNKHPVVFFSHQWLSWDHPDPDKLQYKDMVRACQRICAEKSFGTTDLYIFLDYHSIPQLNVGHEDHTGGSSRMLLLAATDIQPEAPTD